MSAPLRLFRITFVETVFATVEVKAANDDEACDFALAEYRADPEAFIGSGGGVQVLHCDVITEEAA